MIGRIMRRDDGVSLLELSIAFFMSAIIAAAMVAWLVQVAGQESFTREADEAIAAMATAKARLVKELRFAETVDVATSDAHNVVFWSDDDGDDLEDPGETVTWTIQPNGELVRSTDLLTPAVHVAGLVFDSGAGDGSSRFLYNGAGDLVTIELAADVDSTSGPLPKSVQTEVYVRNS